MLQGFCHTYRLLGLLFALALLGSSAGIGRSAAQADSAGCAGAHCLFAPLVSLPQPVVVTSKSIKAFKFYCAISARAVAENTTSTPFSALSIEVELIYATHTATTTLRMFGPILLPGQRAVLRGMASCDENNDRPSVGEVLRVNPTVAFATDYVPLAVVSLDYQCGDIYGNGQSFTATVQNTGLATVTSARIFFDSRGRFAGENTVELGEPIAAGASHMLIYNPIYYDDIGCIGPNTPPPTTVYAYGRVVQ
jgi:hypothetical protein